LNRKTATYPYSIAEKSRLIRNGVRISLEIGLKHPHTEDGDMEREQTAAIVSDLKRKMVFLSGPRQVGKSWLARQIASSHFQRARYLNWDNLQDRRVILEYGWSTTTDLLVLDEIHKMPQWKNHLKGIWDSRKEGMSVLVTGSARLETFRQSGDSLAGRYLHHHLFPITPAEAFRINTPAPLPRFLERGGFPEPFLVDSSDDANRWRRQYVDGLVREDILNFENITQLRAMNLLVELLRERIASPLSYQSLAEDIGVSPNTVKHYISILEALYIVFCVFPYHRSIARALTRQPKLYFFDVGLVRGDMGAKLENLVAVSLLKELCLREDRDGKRRQLACIRTKDGREVDFLTVEEDAPPMMIEVKASDSALSPNLRFFHERYGFKGVQLVADLHSENESGPLHVRRAISFLENPEFDRNT